jgi:hypothetical protein
VCHADKAIVIAVREIAAGDEITISYRQGRCSNVVNQSMMQWRFKCNCGRCHMRPFFEKTIPPYSLDLYREKLPIADQAARANSYDVALKMYLELFTACPSVEVVKPILTMCKAINHLQPLSVVELGRKLAGGGYQTVKELAIPVFVPPEAAACLKLHFMYYRAAACIVALDMPVATLMADYVPKSGAGPFLNPDALGRLIDLAGAIRGVGGYAALRADIPWVVMLHNLLAMTMFPDKLREIYTNAMNMVKAATEYSTSDETERTMMVPLCKQCRKVRAVSIYKPRSCVLYCHICYHSQDM